MPKVGEVYFALTRKRIGNPEPGFKYHLCVCEINRLYLFICSDHYTHDFPISNVDCCGLPNALSYVSFRGIKHVPDDDLRGAECSCLLSTDFIRKLHYFASYVPVLNEKQRRNIVSGLALRL